MVRPGDVVVCRVVKIEQNSVIVELLEHEKKEGFIHISEVASGWVKDIRRHLKEDSVIVAKVRYIKKDNVVLSVKRVTKEQKSEKLKDYKLEQKAEKILSIVAKKLKKRSYKAIKDSLKSQYESIYQAFKIAIDNPEKLDVPAEWQKAIQEVAKKDIGKKEFTIRKEVNIFSYEPDGVERIKQLLACVQKKGLKVGYISPPKYSVSFKTLKPKQDREKPDNIFKKCLNKGIHIEINED